MSFVIPFGLNPGYACHNTCVLDHKPLDHNLFVKSWEGSAFCSTNQAPSERYSYLDPFGLWRGLHCLSPRNDALGDSYLRSTAQNQLSEALTLKWLFILVIHIQIYWRILSTGTKEFFYINALVVAFYLCVQSQIVPLFSFFTFTVFSTVFLLPLGRGEGVIF